MTQKAEVPAKSVAIESDLYEVVRTLATEGGTTLSAVATAIMRLGLPYYQNRWREFTRMFPEMTKDGAKGAFTQNMPTVPRR